MYVNSSLGTLADSVSKLQTFESNLCSSIQIKTILRLKLNQLLSIALDIIIGNQEQIVGYIWKKYWILNNFKNYKCRRSFKSF